MPRLSRLARPIVLTALLAPAAGLLAGCSLVGVLAYKAQGQTKHAPVHVLAKEPTIVLVERSSNPGEVALDAQQVAAEASRLLREQAGIPVVDPGLAVEARSKRNADGTARRPAEIARACGASQIVYVDLTRYQTSADGAVEAVTGDAEATVWVVDARTAQPRWPAEAGQGHPVAAGVPYKPSVTGSSERAVRDEMNRALGQKVARLFYQWSEE